MKKTLLLMLPIVLLIACSKNKLDEATVLKIVNTSIQPDLSWKTFRFELTTYQTNDYYKGLIRNGFIQKKEPVASPDGLGVFNVNYGDVYELTDKAKPYLIRMEDNKNAIVKDQAFIQLGGPVSIFYPVEGGNEANIEMNATFSISPFFNSNLQSYSSRFKMIHFKMKKYEDGWRIDDPNEITGQLQKCN